MVTLRARFPLFLLVFAFLGLALSSCQTDDDDPTPAVSSQYLTVGSWRLDAIREASQTVSTGTDIKDRHSFTFRPDGTYTQTFLEDGETFDGSWMLMGSNTILHFTDHKGDDHQYTLTSLTATELRYSWVNRDNVVEEFVFSAQP
ncbi:lipocalin family protein [Hymenobacter sp. BT186]|uniref:Lipocalin family protein n=1 Tax=Hymenobacter telluris TaxID=2816474 RepID=A0A939F112_9BACT|nr:lipocalin family protein [Hymenobacter telluris]MBO0360801.1 lipocalin family protein [Hymenobacter telluris]MBW3376830.1 lipocalin family protein [Hymenobacter norwichensis]